MLRIWTIANAQPTEKLFKPLLSGSGVTHQFHNDNEFYDIPYNPGDVLLVMGTKLAKRLQDIGELPKNRTVGSLRSKLHNINARDVFITYDPMLVEIDPTKTYDAQWDIMLAMRFAKTGDLEPEIGEYRYVKDFSDARSFVVNEFENINAKVQVCLDLETIGFDEFSPEGRIVTVSLTYETGTADVWIVPKTGKLPDDLREQLEFICTSDKVKMTGANLKFDMRWIKRHWGFWITNQTFDTTLVGGMIDENRSNSLNLHAKIYTGLGGYDDGFNQTFDKSRMDLVLDQDPDRFLTYAGGDTDACYQVTNRFRNELSKDKQMRNFYTKLLQPASVAFAVMENRGMVVDTDRYQELKTEVQSEIDRLESEIISLFPAKLKAKYAGEISLSRPVILREFMFSWRGLDLKPKKEYLTEKTKQPSVSMEHLEQFVDVPEAKLFIDLMREYGSATKTMGTYVDGFLKHIRSDGLFHPSYMMYRGDYGGRGGGASGTVTGRTSARDPAVQCQPGWSQILTRDGYKTMDRIIQGLERGEEIEVLSHDGTWRKAYAPYDNGMQPIYRLWLSDGKMLDCTGNHRVLTKRGWIEVQYLNTSDQVVTHDAPIPELNRGTLRKIESLEPRWNHVSCEVGMPLPMRGISDGDCRESQIREHHKLRLLCTSASTYPRAPLWTQREAHSNLPVLGGYAIPYYQPEFFPVDGLRGAGDYLLRALGGLRNLLGGYGGETSRLFDRTDRQQRQLRTGELHMDSPPRSIQESTKTETGAGSKDGENFGCASVQRIDILDPHQTWGIAVEQTHSYVSEGIVNHNTIPKHTIWAKPLRSVYTPPPGHAILLVDYSQGELRVTACVANELTMIETYRQGLDLHLRTGSRVYGMDFEEALKLKEAGDPAVKKIRQGGKAGNFGLIYGMGANGFQHYARTSYGVELTMDETHAFVDGFFGEYPGLNTWHERSKNVARQQGYIRSPLGRIRHLPMMNSRDNQLRAQQERQSINSPIQCTLSDLGLLAIAKLYEQYPDLWVFSFTHDEIGCYVPIDELEIWAKRVVDVMENLPLKKDFGWEPQLTFVAEPEYSLANMASCEELII